MSPPDPGQLKVAIAAFTGDAKFWDDCAGTLGQAKQGVSGLTLRNLDFGPAALFGVPDKYNEVQQMVADRCGEGVTEFQTIAGNLIKSRDAYQKAEEDNVHAINNSW
jgi:hypothetical protein